MDSALCDAFEVASAWEDVQGPKVAEAMTSLRDDEEAKAGNGGKGVRVLVPMKAQKAEEEVVAAYASLGEALSEAEEGDEGEKRNCHALVVVEEGVVESASTSQP